MKKYLFGYLAILLAIGTSAFTSASVSKKSGLTTIVYHYTSNSDQLTDMKNIDNWVAEEPSCGITGDIPCAVEYNGDRSAFEIYLSGFSDVPSLTAVASERKNS